MQSRKTVLFPLVLILYIPFALGLVGKLPEISEVIKHHAGYSYSVTLKFTYSPLLTALYNKIDIFKCKLEGNADSPTQIQLVRTLDANLDTHYKVDLEAMPTGEACLQVCGRSSYRSVKKCSKVYPFDNKIKHKHTSSANKHKQNVDKLGSSLLIKPTCLTARVIGYDLVLIWKYFHPIASQYSLSIKLLAEVDRSITFRNGGSELALQAATNSAIVRLPYSHFKFGSIRVSLCCMFPSDGEEGFTEKSCSLPLLIPNNIAEYTEKSGVVGILVDRGEAHVRLTRPISSHTERVFVECTGFDSRAELPGEDRILKQEVPRSSENLWDLVIADLELHTAYSCYIHLVNGNNYMLYSHTPFVFHTPDL